MVLVPYLQRSDAQLLKINRVFVRIIIMYIMYRAWTSLATINSFPLAGDAARLLDPNLLCIHCFVSSSAMSCETRVVSQVGVS